MAKTKVLSLSYVKLLQDDQFKKIQKFDFFLFLFKARFNIAGQVRLVQPKVQSGRKVASSRRLVQQISLDDQVKQKFIFKHISLFSRAVVPKHFGSRTN